MLGSSRINIPLSSARSPCGPEPRAEVAHCTQPCPGRGAAVRTIISTNFSKAGFIAVRENSLSSGEVQQSKKCKPQQRHKVPVPARGVHSNLLRFKFALDPFPGKCVEQHCNSSEQMNSVQPGKRIKEGSARASAQIHSLMPQRGPHEQLARNKTKSQQNGDSQPWQLRLESWREDSHGRELRLPHQATARHFQTETAGNEEKGIDPQLAIGKNDCLPIAYMRFLNGNPRPHLLPDDIGAGNSRKEHQHADGEKRYAHAITPQALLAGAKIVGLPGVAVIIATVAAMNGNLPRPPAAKLGMLFMNATASDGHMYF